MTTATGTTTATSQTRSRSRRPAPTASPSPPDDTTLVRRFTVWQRLTHAVLALSVFGLVFTGMPLKFSSTFWAEPLIDVWGGPWLAGRFHRVFALGFFLSAVMHVGEIALAVARRRVHSPFHPDSIVPRPEDARHLVQYLRFMTDRGPRPEFGKFTYWEKFDYLAPTWGLVIIGLSGLIMWFPEQSLGALPGWAVNAALIFHSDEAFLAAGFLFGIHFFNTHLRPEAFPVDMVMVTGTVTLDELRHERPGWYERLTTTGELDRLIVRTPRRASRALVLGGMVLLALGILMMLLVVTTAVLEAWHYLSSALG